MDSLFPDKHSTFANVEPYGEVVNIKGRIGWFLSQPDAVYIGRGGWYSVTRDDAAEIARVMPPEWCAKRLLRYDREGLSSKLPGRVWLIGDGWGNPFRIGRDGDRDEVMAKYMKWLPTQSRLIARARAELPGKLLGCWCIPPGGSQGRLLCHGQPLLAAATGAGVPYVG